MFDLIMDLIVGPLLDMLSSKHFSGEWRLSYLFPVATALGVGLWWVGDRADGGWVAVKLMNALSTGGISLQTTKSGKGQTSVTLTGHVSIDAQDVVPMEFYIGAPGEEG